MGWTTCFTAKHWKTVKGRPVVDRKACVDDLYTFQNKDADGRVIASTRVLRSSLVGSTWYGACETVRDGKATVWAGVCLTCGKSNFDSTVWGYKEMDESMSPFSYNCPRSILKLLTEPTSDNARRWRENCVSHAAAKKATKKITMPSGVTAKYRGSWIITSPEYRASNYYSGVRYRLMSKRSAIDKFVADHGTDAQKAEWEKIKAAAA